MGVIELVKVIDSLAEGVIEGVIGRVILLVRQIYILAPRHTIIPRLLNYRE